MTFYRQHISVIFRVSHFQTLSIQPSKWGDLRTPLVLHLAYHTVTVIRSSLQTSHVIIVY